MRINLGLMAEGASGAVRLADSLKIRKVLAATAATAYNGVMGHIEFDDRDDLQGGAITLGDLNDKKIVPTVVKT